MIELIESKRLELEALCRRFGVARLEVFGSAADGRFDPARSDLDFLVEFCADSALGPADAYFGLLWALEALFQRPIDLVEAGAIRNRFLRKSIDLSRALVYAA